MVTMLSGQLLSTLLAFSEFFMVFTNDYQNYLNVSTVNKCDGCNTNITRVQFPKPIQLHKRKINKNIYESNNSEVSRNVKSNESGLLDLLLQASAKEGLQAMENLYDMIEPELIRKEQVLQNNHPAALLSKFSNPEENTTSQEMAAFAMLSAAKAFRRNFNLARKAHSPKISLRHTELEVLCTPRNLLVCQPSSKRYRTHDGTCNNQHQSRWGAALMPFHRLLPPEYGDGVDTIRNAADGGTLPSSRFISLLVHGAREGEAPFTLMLAQWGQLLDHDMTSTAQPRPINGSIPSCCGGKNFHPSCFPIKVPFDDPWLSPLKIRCLEFLRSAPAQRMDCELSWREQTNQASSFIDASPIYSSSIKASNSARTFQNGLLIFGHNNSFNDVCQRAALAPHCIRAGDARSSEQPGLLALHHVWVGEHNRIASELSQLNSHWSDEKIFQETRRIIGAIFQHITYNEFLPVILGREVLKLFDLELLKSGYYEGYNPEINPTVANEFSAAAFRFGHSLVQNSYIRCDRFHNVINIKQQCLNSTQNTIDVSLHQEFQRGDIGTAGSLHRLLRGMSNQNILKRDEFITPELTNHLFQTPGFPFGLDLAAINIQRGRDHGLPPYTRWRIPCGLSPITSWEDFAISVGPESAKRIGHAYRSVHDIDLFVGGIAERPVTGALVGPTFACIIAQQFHNTRKGDRFWYENGNFESSFSPSQLQSIRSITLAQILCRAVNSGTFQPHIFLPPNLTNNVRLSCDVGPLAKIDLSSWLEVDPFLSHTSTSAQPSHEFIEEFPDRIFNIIPLQFQSQLPIRDNKISFLSRIKEANVAKPVRSTTILFDQFIKSESKISDKLDFERKRLLSSEERHILDKKSALQLPVAKSSTYSQSTSDGLRYVMAEFTQANFTEEETIEAGEPTSERYSTELISTMHCNENFTNENGKAKTLRFQVSDDTVINIKNLTSSSCEANNENHSSIALKNTKIDLLNRHIYKKIENRDKSEKFERDLGFTLSVNSTRGEVSNNHPIHSKLLTTTDAGVVPMNYALFEDYRKPKKEESSNRIVKMPSSTNSNNTMLIRNKTLLPILFDIPNATLEEKNDYLSPYIGMINNDTNKGKEYQIEINIRQKNKNRKPIKTTQYEDSTNQNDDYTLRYTKRITTYATFSPIATTEMFANIQGPFTKPPIILIVDEGLYKPTTQKSVKHQNIANWNSGKLNSASSFSIKSNKDTAYDRFISNSAPFSVSSHSQTSTGIVGSVINNALSETNVDRISSASRDTIFSFNLKVNSDISSSSSQLTRYGYGSTVMPWQTQTPIHTNYLEASNSNSNFPDVHPGSSPYSSSNSQPTYFRG
uniref:Chorion peroxidase n=1 Tax=Glossina brevipalpis TaxID=37001 RepID=A0A1A9W6N9_9MUSC